MRRRRPAPDTPLMRSLRGTTGYTLVELLVVMVILSVLAAVAIPLFQGQRQRAYKAAMVSDLRSLQLAQMARAVDEDPRYTDDVTLLASQGYVRSDRVSNVHVAIFEQAGEKEYVACVKHDQIDDWLVFNSLSGGTTYSPDVCVAP